MGVVYDQVGSKADIVDRIIQQSPPTIKLTTTYVNSAYRSNSVDTFLELHSEDVVQAGRVSWPAVFPRENPNSPGRPTFLPTQSFFAKTFLQPQPLQTPLDH